MLDTEYLDPSQLKKIIPFYSISKKVFFFYFLKKKNETQHSKKETQGSISNPLSSTYRSTQNEKGDSESEEEESQSTPKSSRANKKRRLEKNSSLKENKNENTLQSGSGMKIVLNLKQSQQQSLSTSCKSIINALMKHRLSYPFLEPVNPQALGIPDYFTIIKHPMDFGTILSNINNSVYSSTNQFVEDTRLVFSNALTYNPPGTHVHDMALKLSSFFEKQLNSYGIQYNSTQAANQTDSQITSKETEKIESKPLNIKISFSAKKTSNENEM